MIFGFRNHYLGKFNILFFCRYLIILKNNIYNYSNIHYISDIIPYLISDNYIDKIDIIIPIILSFLGKRRILIPYLKKNILYYYPKQYIIHMGWRNLIPYKDKHNINNPIYILFIEDDTFWSLMKINLILLSQSKYSS